MILLAGGAGSRAGIPKALFEWRGRPWVLHQLDACRNLGVQKIILVLGHSSEQVQAILGRSPVLLEIVTNPDPNRGSFSSLQTGLRAVPSGSGTFVLPIDVPVPDTDTWSRLQNASVRYRDSSAIIPRFGELPGHPVYLSSLFIRKLVDLDPNSPDSRLDVQIQAIPAQKRTHVPVSNSRVLSNLNTEEDWNALNE